VSLDAQSVADAFRLGRAESLSEPVARGELGQVRRLVTDQGTWAVKESLKDVDDGGVHAFERSGAFQLACWEAGVPTPEPRPAAGGSMTAEVGGELLRAYGWVDLHDPDTGLDPVEVGTLLAALHAVRRPVVGAVHEWFEAPVGEREWSAVLKASRGAGAPYADQLAELLPHLLAVESLMSPMAAVQTCHLDLWSDNVRRRTSDGTAWVIDFDNAGPADPSREVAMVVFEFGQGEAGRQRAVYDAYRDAGGAGRISSRADVALTVAQLHHIGHRHLRMWLASRDSESRARSLAGVEEFLDAPLLIPDADRLLDAVV
jgi:Ser/Thr protein kinase RdoA (MazF antagonist)